VGHQHTRHARLSRDTDADAEARQIAAWRAMTPAALARLVDEASQAVRDLAMAGLKARYPGATDRELTIRFAALTVGDELAERAYPEIRSLSR
jgi:hypothetical protein